MNYSEVTVITPTLNEEKSIGKLIKIITKLYQGINIIVVDDGSKDNTRGIVSFYANKNQNIKLIDRSNQLTKGLTASVIEGIENTQTKYSIIIDADLQHPPEKIKDIVKSLNDGYELVIGYRAKIGIDWPLYRRIITKIGIALGTLRLFLTGSPIPKDILSGYFGVRTEIFKNILHTNKSDFNLEGYKVLFELLKHLYKSTKIKEFPFTFDIRREGQSKLTNKIMLHYLESIFK